MDTPQDPKTRGLPLFDHLSNQLQSPPPLPQALKDAFLTLDRVAASHKAAMENVEDAHDALDRHPGHVQRQNLEEASRAANNANAQLRQTLLGTGAMLKTFLSTTGHQKFFAQNSTVLCWEARLRELHNLVRYGQPEPQPTAQVINLASRRK